MVAIAVQGHPSLPPSSRSTASKARRPLADSDGRREARRSGRREADRWRQRLASTATGGSVTLVRHHLQSWRDEREGSWIRREEFT